MVTRAGGVVPEEARPLRQGEQVVRQPLSKEKLLEVLGVMREHKVLRLKMGGLEVELHPLAFLPEAPAVDDGKPPVPNDDPFPDDGAGRCACGHHPVTEHGPNGEGCLLGCSAELCASEPGPSTEPAEGGA